MGRGKMGGGALKGCGMAWGWGRVRNSIQFSLLKSHFLQSQIIVFIKVKRGKKKGRRKKAEAAHWADWALVFLIVPNGY